MFMTFSFNDNHDALLNKVYQDVYEIYGINNFNLIGIDPGVSNHFFYYRTQNLLKYLSETYGL